MTSVSIIINPVSGPARRGSGAERVALAARMLDRLGVKADVRVTERAGHAHQLAMEAAAAGVDLVVAWGGDGTMNEVARALVQRGDEAAPGQPLPALGLVPGGSGNGLARELGIPFDPARAIERAIQASVRQIDAGELGGRLFFNVAGIGLDAHVAALVSTRINHRGLLPYLKATAGDLLRYAPIDYTVTADGQTSHVSALVVALANSKQYGFGATIASGASLEDGYLDLVIVEDRKLAGNLLRIPSFFLGRLHQQDGIKTSRVQELTIRSKDPMLFHIDGEAVQGTDTLVARVHPGGLRLRA
ncbi:MAG TPA: diacylglycerol kinase family protein [Vicinamibacterales bacterium]|nr:diacylglycerol kinase family protein [Vicinamibacterales bacterium]